MSSYSGLVTVSFQDAVGVRTQRTRKRLYQILPRVLIGDERSGVKSTTYRLKKLNTAMRTSRVRERPPGTKPHLGNPADVSTVSVATRQYETEAAPVLLPLQEPHLTEEIDDIMAQQLDSYELAVDNEIATFLASSTYHNSVTFQGTGALDNFNTDHLPRYDIDAAIRTYWAPYEHLEGFSREAILDKQVAITLGYYPDYRDAQYNDRGSKSVDLDAFVQVFKTAHGLDDVHIVSGGIDEADDGATSTLTRFAAGLCSFQMFDRQRDGRVLREGGRDRPFGLDGSAGLAISRDLVSRDWEEEDSEALWMAVVDAHEVFSPRYRADTLKLGFTFASSEIFT